MSTRRNLKYKYLKTKAALSDTVQKLLDINRKRRFTMFDPGKQEKLEEELKILNATAENQAMMIRSYEVQIARQEEARA